MTENNAAHQNYLAAHRAVSEVLEANSVFVGGKTINAIVDAVLSKLSAEGVQAGEETGTHVEARECVACDHVGINDSSDTQAACNNCDWSGDSPKEDHCPGCAHTGTMTAACPKCGGQYRLLADRTISAALASAPVAGEASVVWKHTHRISGVIDLSMEDLEGNAFNREKWESVPHYSAPQGSAPVAGEVVAWRVTHPRCPQPGWRDAAREPAPSLKEVKQQDADLALELAYAAPQASEAVRTHNDAIEAAAKVCIDIARQYDPQNSQENALASELYAAARIIRKQAKEDSAALAAQPGAQKGGGYAN